jgi:hypothetical protein
MKSKLFWLVAGGLLFWLPAMWVGVSLHQSASTVLMNILSLAGLILLGLFSWIYAKHFPRWGWVLAGIYVLGPSLNAGTFSICQAFPCAISSRWNLDISSAMPIPTEHPMVFAVEWDDLFGANRYSDTSVPSEA